ncbi:MAG: sigma-70 family RNA polymerase sigma factor [Anaerolineales bacterium]|nr:sigma-70 family RNA polymerase sigma factor [Anaerolineales bacterium]
MAYPGKRMQNSQIFEKLLERAELQGYISTEDILEIYPAIASKSEQIERLKTAIRAQGIEMLDDDLAEPEDADSSESIEEGLSSFEHIASDDTVSLYLKEMSITPLLTVEEELSLAKRIVRGRQARRQISRQNGQDPQRRRELEALALDGRLARDALIKANTRLVVSIARRYLGRGVPFLDLIQEGNLGLMKAVEKYEHQRGFRFSTYATWWIRQSIIRSIADQGRTIRVPVHMVDRLRQIYKASREMEQKLGRSPTPQELAAQLNLDSTKLHWMLQVSQQPISLESPVGDEDDSELGMYVEDSASPSPAQLTYENMLRERVDEVLATLSPREARILRLRFGLGQDRAYTLEEVGQKFGLTRERIRQIEGKALRRLRQPNRARLLREYN